jgi:hypothetical protein
LRVTHLSFFREYVYHSKAFFPPWEDSHQPFCVLQHGCVINQGHFLIHREKINSFEIDIYLKDIDPRESSSE